MSNYRILELDNLNYAADWESEDIEFTTPNQALNWCHENKYYTDMWWMIVDEQNKIVYVYYAGTAFTPRMDMPDPLRRVKE